MDGVVRQVQEEGPVPVSADEADRLVGETVREVLLVVPGLEVRRPEPEVAAGGRAGFGAADVEVEALVLGPELGTAQVPLADRRGGVSGRPQRLGGRDLLKRELLADLGRRSFCEGRSARPGSQSVRCSLAGYFPVMSAARDGEQTGHAA